MTAIIHATLYAHGYHPRRVWVRLRGAIWYYWPMAAVVTGFAAAVAVVVWG